MTHGTLVRAASTDAGTFGFLAFPAEGLSFYTAELPWRENRPKESCIPAGTYQVIWDTAGDVIGYLLQGVPGRGEIQIHVGNWAGDVRKGLRSDSKGCILLGLSRSVLQGQPAVGRSEPAIQQLHAFLDRKPWMLTIVDGHNG
jgi:hypothetical protein